MTRYQIVGVAFFVLVIITALFFLVTQDTLPKLSASDVGQRVSGHDLNDLKVYWSREITEIGPEAAYQKFIKSATDDAVDVDSHTQAHVFGEALYETGGLEAVRFCDHSFAFGCFHSFFGSAVHQSGIEVLKKFDQVCIDKYNSKNLPCQHGIGHGVMVYTGYENLVEALDLCRAISWQPTGGCSSGVFMEYNFHIMDAAEGQDFLRPPTENLYEPCDSLPTEYQPSCYYEQVEWWQNTMNSDWLKINRLCEALSDNQENFNACYSAVGHYVAASNNYDAGLVGQICSTMPTAETVALCSEGALWLIIAEPGKVSDAYNLCSELELPYNKQCEDKLSHALEDNTIRPTKNIDELYVEANTLYEQGNYAGAIALYEQIMAQQPNNTRPILNAAHTYRYWGKYDQSEELFLAALKIDDTNSWVYTDLGKLYRNMNEYEKAETVFQKSLSLNPNRSETYSYGLGYLYFEQKRFAEAEAMFIKALELDQGSEIAHSGLADLYREMGRYAESAAMYEKVFTINPHSESYLGIAWLYIRQKRYADAITACKNFLTNIREKGEVYYTMGVAYKEQGDTAKAKAAFAKAVELNPSNILFIDALRQVTDG